MGGGCTIIRKLASIHRGTQPESWTILGENCFILGYAHIGRDCELGNSVKLYNCAALSGYVIVGDKRVKVSRLVEDLRAAIAAVDNVVTDASNGSSGGSWHAESVSKVEREVKN